MSMFMIDTDGVSAVSDEIYSLVSEFKSLTDTVAAMDTTCPDGIDFNTAKEVIRGNIDACSVKVENSLKVSEEVSRQHTSLQNSFSIDDYASAYTPGTKGTTTPVSTDSDSSSSKSGSNSSSGDNQSSETATTVRRKTNPEDSGTTSQGALSEQLPSAVPEGQDYESTTPTYDN